MVDQGVESKIEDNERDSLTGWGNDNFFIA